MAAAILALLFAIQACIGMPMNDECCGSKIVGEFAYTLVETTVDFPNECLNSCAYSRDDQPGSLYCFAPGNQAVTCTGETPIFQNCFPGPPGPTGCPPENNLKITNNPNTYGTRPSSTDCWDFCRALCPGVRIPCECNAWTYNKFDQMCLTFDSYPVCYDTIKEDGWVSGAPCYESYTAPIKDKEDIPGESVQQTFRYGPFGNLPGTLNGFNDQHQATDVSEITIVTGTNTDVNREVITGIKFGYRDSARKPILHGQAFANKTGQKTITCKIQPKTYFNKIRVRSFENQNGDPESNLVYYLQFLSTDTTMKQCSLGSEKVGNLSNIPKAEEAKKLNSISGDTYGSGNGTIADLYFTFVV